MNYYSTRDSERKIAKTSAEVIKQGIAEDGGLFLPESIPEISLDFIKEMGTLPYSERAAKLLSLYLTDYTYDELLDCAQKAYDEGFGDFAAPVSSFIGDDSLENKLKLALDRLKASVTLGLIRKMSRGTKTHITCVVGYLSVYLRVTLEGNSVKGYGRDGVIKGEAALFSAEKRAYI